MKKLTSQETSRTQPINADWDAAWEEVAPESNCLTEIPDGCKSAAGFAKERGLSISHAMRLLRDEVSSGRLETFKVKPPGAKLPAAYYRPKKSTK